MNRLDQISQQIQKQSQPPVDTWAPDHHGEIDICIDVNGNWFHEGDQIKRDGLVALFSSILWAEAEGYYLVTPAEKLRIKVADVPYMIHQAELCDDAWVVTTHTHEQVILDQDHPVELRKFQDQWIPYVKVRYELWARVNRSIYYQWVDLALQKGGDDPRLELASGDYKFMVAR